MEQTRLRAEVRDETGTAAVRRLRRAGKIPAVVYGHRQDPVAILLNAEDCHRVVAHRIKMISLRVGRKTEQALVKDVQFDTFGDAILHMDFERVAMDEVIEVECPVELAGTSKGAAAGGVVEHPVTDLKVRCLPANIPDVIRVAVSHLEIGDAVHVRDIPAPEGVTILTDPEAILVAIRPPAKVEEEVPEVVEAAGPEEPEVIRREKAEGEEADEKTE